MTPFEEILHADNPIAVFADHLTNWARLPEPYPRVSTYFGMTRMDFNILDTLIEQGSSEELAEFFISRFSSL